MKKILLITLFISVFASLAFCQGDDFSVEIEPKNTLVSKSDRYFSVFTRVVNTSGKDQTIYIWNCSYEDSWEANNSSVALGGDVCSSHYRSPKLIKQGEKLEEDISLHIEESAEPGDITFKLGFRFSTNDDYPPKHEQIYWSNPVTIRYESASLPAAR